MFKHFFTIAIRSLGRNKIFSLINVFGLSIGLGVFLMISQYIYFESSYDQFFTNSDTIYRITSTSSNGGEIHHSSGTGYAVGPRGKELIPEIEQFVRIHPQTERMVVSNSLNNIRYQENRSWYVDQNFLQMFDFPLVQGDSHAALNDKNNVVITEDIAIKYFGEIDCIGRELKINEGQLRGVFTVTGILKTLPENSHLKFDILLPMDFLLEYEKTYSEGLSTGWDWLNFITYVKLGKNIELDKVEEKFNQIFQQHIGDNLQEASVTLKTELQPITTIHLGSDYPNRLSSRNGNHKNISYFFFIFIFILLMAWANYINLSTVQALGRAKEIGVKKIIGAARKQLMGQFLAESFLINFLAAFLSIGLGYFLLPLLSQIIGHDLSLDILYKLEFISIFLVIIVFGSLLSGLYAAFVLTSYKPIEVLKSNYIKRRGGINMRKGLITFQFFVSILLIASTYLIYKQILFMKNQDLGLDIEKILVLDGPNLILEEDISIQQSKFQVFKSQLTQHHAITEVTGSGSIPGKGGNATLEFWRPDAPNESNHDSRVVFVDADFFTAYNIELVSGDGFRERDAWIPNDVIINSEAVKIFGLGDSESAIGQKLIADFGGVDTVTVSGVVKDFYWSSVKDIQTPHVFVHNLYYNSYYSLKINVNDIQSSIAHIQNSYNTAFPNDPFNYYFLDEDFNRQYQADLQFANLFSAFSLLAIFIACLGLFALVSVSAILRAKEMSIRKVLGASISKLILLLVQEYLLLMGVATFLAIPTIIWGGKAWLKNYPNKVTISIDLFILPSLILLLIALLTVGYQIYTTAKMNPAKALE